MENNPYQSPKTDSNNVVSEPGIWPPLPKWYKWLAAVVGAAMTYVGVAFVTYLAGAIVVIIVYPSLVDGPNEFRAFPKGILFVIAICVGMVAAIRSVLRTFKLFEEF